MSDWCFYILKAENWIYTPTERHNPTSTPTSIFRKYYIPQQQRERRKKRFLDILHSIYTIILVFFSIIPHPLLINCACDIFIRFVLYVHHLPPTQQHTKNFKFQQHSKTYATDNTNSNLKIQKWLREMIKNIFAKIQNLRKASAHQSWSTVTITAHLFSVYGGLCPVPKYMHISIYYMDGGFTTATTTQQKCGEVGIDFIFGEFRSNTENLYRFDRVKV